MSPLPLPRELDLLAPTIVDDLVRVGNRNDGGYVVPAKTISMVDTLVSMGINDDWQFEEDMLRRKQGLKLHAYDHTISKRIFLRNAALSAVNVILLRARVAELRRRARLYNGYRKFFVGQAVHFQQRVHDPRHLAMDVDIDGVFERIRSDRIFLKVDIEGSEYRIVSPLLRYHARIVCMAIECHDTDPRRLVFLSAVRAIQEHFELVHLHGNNYEPVGSDGLPEALELTFLRRDLCRGLGKRTSLPVPLLDQPNDSYAADYEMTFSLGDPVRRASSSP